LLNISTFQALYFISDANLGAPIGVSEAEKRARLFAFGKNIASKDNKLFIIGDLFDFWFEWRKVIPKRHFRVLRELAMWRDNGLDMYYLAGNHDFRLGGFLENEIGIKTFGNELNLTAAGKNFHLFHGDGVQKSDVGYRFLKKIFRSGLNQQLFLLLHPDFGMKLADWSSSKSRNSNLLKNPSKLENDYIEYAERKNSQGFDYILMGHTHRPLLYKLTSGLYINTGNWYQDFTYAKFSDDEISLKYFRGSLE